MRKWVGMNKNTIVDWFNFCREVCAIYMDHIDTEKIALLNKKARGVLGLRGVTAQGVLWQHTRVLS